MKRILLITLSTFVLSSVFPQQTFKTKNPKDSLTLSYRIGTDFSMSFGNVNSYNSLNEGYLEVDQRIIGFDALARYRYGWLAGTQNASELQTNLNIKIYPRYWVYAFAKGGVESSFMRATSLRGFVGGGAEFRPIDNEKHTFKPYIGYMFEHNDYREPILLANDSAYTWTTHRGIVGWSGVHKFAKGRIILTHNFNWVHSFVNFKRYRFYGSIDILIPVWKMITIRTAFYGSYDNLVPIGFVSQDMLFTVGILATNF